MNREAWRAAVHGVAELNMTWQMNNLQDYLPLNFRCQMQAQILTYASDWLATDWNFQQSLLH